MLATDSFIVTRLSPRFQALGLGLALSLFVSLASAQDPAAAEALFRSAQEAVEEGDWARACQLFEDSNRLDPAAGTVLNLARCNEEQGKLASAWRYYQEAAEKLPERDRRTAYAEAKIRELEGQVPKINFAPPEELADGDTFSLTVNGTSYSATMMGVELPFDPGLVEIVVEADGHEAYTVSLELVPGQVQATRLKLGPVIASVDVDLPSVDAPSKKSKAWPVALLSVGGAGAALGVAGAVWTGVELPKATDSDHCSDGACDKIGAQASRRGRTAVILMGSGIAVAALGLTLGSLLLFENDTTEVSVHPTAGGGTVEFAIRSFNLFSPH